MLQASVTRTFAAIGTGVLGSELIVLNLWVESMEVLYLPHESIHLVQYMFY